MPELQFPPALLWVITGCMLLGAQCAATGCFGVLRRQSLAGDAVAHAVLPGICLAFLLSGSKSMVFLLPGAALTGWLSLLCIEYLPRLGKIRQDAATGIVLSVFFGLGIMLLTSIQQGGNADQSGLDKFLLGKAAGMMPQDIEILAITTFLSMLIIALVWKEFAAWIFDPNFAESAGLPVRLLSFLQTVLLIIAVVTGIQAVGVVLMAALLITPAASARYWSDSLITVFILSIVFGITGTFTGVIASFILPEAPTGASIVLALSLLFALSAIAAPRRGAISRIITQFLHRRRTEEENILKACYQVAAQNCAEPDILSKQPCIVQIPEIASRRGYSSGDMRLRRILRRLVRQGYCSVLQQDLCQLTPEGFARGKRITRLHRLWEVYLTRAMSLPPDHVHDDAESIEHILTPELEKELESLLEFPSIDPHGEYIPPASR
jgi:manganese/zinc/iron transport system permease protein